MRLYTLLEYVSQKNLGPFHQRDIISFHSNNKLSLGQQKVSLIFHLAIHLPHGIFIILLCVPYNVSCMTNRPSHAVPRFVLRDVESRKVINYIRNRVYIFHKQLIIMKSNIIKLETLLIMIIQLSALTVEYIGVYSCAKTNCRKFIRVWCLSFARV